METFGGKKENVRVEIGYSGPMLFLTILVFYVKGQIRIRTQKKNIPTILIESYQDMEIIYLIKKKKNPTLLIDAINISKLSNLFFF